MSIRIPRGYRRQVKAMQAWGELNQWASDADQTIVEILQSLAEAGRLLARLTNQTTPSTTIMAHAPKHLPDGSDPLTTAIAGTILPDDAAAVGTANALARSDHKHAIATTTAVALASASSEGVATSFSRADHVHIFPDRLQMAGFTTTGQLIMDDFGTLTRLTFPTDNANVQFVIPGTATFDGGIGCTAMVATGTSSSKKWSLTAPASGGGWIGSCSPFADNVLDVGLAAGPFRWKDGNFAGTVTAGTFSGGFTLGAANFAVPNNTFAVTPVEGVATTAIRTDATLRAPNLLQSLTATAGDTITMTSNGTTIVLTPNRVLANWAASWTPATTGNRNLGTPTLLWNAMNSVSIKTSGAATIGTSLAVGTSLTAADATISNILTVNNGIVSGGNVSATDFSGLWNGDFDSLSASNMSGWGILSTLIGVDILDSGSAFELELRSVSNPTISVVNRTLTFDVANGSRTLRLTGNVTANQDVSTTGSPTFVSPVATTAFLPASNGGATVGANGLGVASVWFKDTASSLETKLQFTDAFPAADTVLTVSLDGASRAFTVSGTAKVNQDVTSNGSPAFVTISLGTGAVGAPALAITGDSNTGIWSSAADTIDITCGGVSILTVSGPSALVTVKNAIDFAVGSITGTKFGTATTQKLGFYNATPVVQRSDAGALTDSTGGAVNGTLVDVGVLFNQGNINDNFADCAAKINALRTAMRDLGFMA